MRSDFNRWRDITSQYIKYRTVCNRCQIQLNHAQTVFFILQWPEALLDQKEQYLIANHRRNTIQSILTHWAETVIANQDKYTFPQQAYQQIQTTRTLSYQQIQTTHYKPQKSGVYNTGYYIQTQQRANGMYKVAIYNKVWKKWNVFCRIISPAKLHESCAYRF
eukprot:1065448_1